MMKQLSQSSFDDGVFMTPLSIHSQGQMKAIHGSQTIYLCIYQVEV